MPVLRSGVSAKFTTVLLVGFAALEGVGIAIGAPTADLATVPLVFVVVAALTGALLASYGTRIRRLTAALEAVAAGEIRVTFETAGSADVAEQAVAGHRTVGRLRDTLVTDRAQRRGPQHRLAHGARHERGDVGPPQRRTAAMADARLPRRQTQVSNNVRRPSPRPPSSSAATIREVAVPRRRRVAGRQCTPRTQATSANASTVSALSESSHAGRAGRRADPDHRGPDPPARPQRHDRGGPGRRRRPLGFTVVAGEVKALAAGDRPRDRAGQPVRAGDPGRLRTMAGRAINADHHRPSSRSPRTRSAIAAAVEQQTAATHEIGRGAQRTPLRWARAEIAENIATLARVPRAGDGLRRRAVPGTSAGRDRGHRRSELKRLDPRPRPGRAAPWTPRGVRPGGRHRGLRRRRGDGRPGHRGKGTGLQRVRLPGQRGAHSLTNPNAAEGEDGTNSYSSMTGGRRSRCGSSGTQITFFAVTDANHGVAAVSVDGGPRRCSSTSTPRCATSRPTCGRARSSRTASTSSGSASRAP